MKNKKSILLQQCPKPNIKIVERGRSEIPNRNKRPHFPALIKAHQQKVVGLNKRHNVSTLFFFQTFNGNRSDTGRAVFSRQQYPKNILECFKYECLNFAWLFSQIILHFEIEISVDIMILRRSLRFVQPLNSENRRKNDL